MGSPAVWHIYDYAVDSATAFEIWSRCAARVIHSLGRRVDVCFCRRGSWRDVQGCGVMVAKSFVMMVLATLLGPALGIGLFVLLNSM
jgi:hypothetical protein